jgi:hypothetical protein
MTSPKSASSEACNHDLKPHTRAEDYEWWCLVTQTHRWDCIYNTKLLYSRLQVD